MPLPTLLAFMLLAALATALAGRQELRVSPRPVLLTRTFAAYLIYACLVVVPVSVYFYVFHGDWFLLYVLDVSRVPSAIALVGFIGEVLLGIGAFLIGAVLVRAQRETLVAILLAAALGGAVAVFPLYGERLVQVGSFAQFHGQFGLEPFGQGPLLLGSVAMSGIVLVGLGFLLGRVWYTGRRSA
jgi:hypothetical protein